MAAIPRFIRPKPISIKENKMLTEAWVVDRICEDPSVLGLGEIEVRDKERRHPGAGRLDLLCQDADGGRRYEIEIQLGRTDESHIIRTIEYWDLERKRYPAYEHIAVIVAEQITSRFFNVIGLFNAHIPICAIHMQAFDYGNNEIALTFTKVLDVVRQGLPEKDEKAASQPANREYWQTKVGQEPLQALDDCFKLLNEIQPGFSPKYTKYYIRAQRDGVLERFINFTPRKTRLVCSMLTPNTEPTEKLEAAKLDFKYEPDAESGDNYTLILRPDDVRTHREVIMDLLRRALAEYYKEDVEQPANAEGSPSPS